jgi:hypothetical protein
MRQGLDAHLDNLVSSGENRDARLPEHGDVPAPDHGENARLSEPDSLPACENCPSALRFRALRGKILAWLDGSGNCDALFVALDMLHHHDCVGARREWSPRHDLDRAINVDFAVVHLSGSHFANDREFSWHIGHTDRKAISG